MYVPMIIVLFVTLPVMALMRRILGWRVEGLMQRASSQAPAEPTAKEVRVSKAAGKPQILLVDRSSTSTDDDHTRRAAAQQARSLFRRWCLYDALLVGTLFAAFHLYHWITFGTVVHLRHSPIGDPGAFPLTWIGAAYLTLVGLRYVLYVRNYHDGAISSMAPPGWFRRWVFSPFDVFFSAALRPRYAWFPLLLLAYGAFKFGHTTVGTELGLYPLITLLLLAAWILRAYVNRLGQKGANRRLLILRVFGRDQNASLTFGALRNYWQHIGPSYTVVDPSFIRYKYRGDSEERLAIVFFACVLVVLLGVLPSFGQEMVTVGIVLSILIVLGYGVALFFMYVQAPWSFAASREQTRDRLGKFLRRPRKWDLTFKAFDLHGFKNTWLDAVAEFAAASDVVLMDLRGFSASNQGCRTEMDLIFDSYPVSKIVFLVDSDSDMHGVEAAIHERWETMSKDSPNLSQREPVVRIYQSKDQSAGDVKALINVLVSSATQSQGERVAHASLAAGA